MSQSISFFGAAQTVTGSRHLIETNGKKILVDCGLFQGTRELKDRNWQPFPIPPHEIDAMVITHAHLDHIGYIPRLVKEGFQGPIYATKATVELARISLPDSGRLQEEDAYHANRHGSRHKPALPLYTEHEAYECLKQFVPLHYHQFHDLPGGATWQYLPAGHILGSAYAEIYFDNGERILMSGDLGRYNTPIIKDPTPIEFAEYLVVESTYGDRLHPTEDPCEKIREVMQRAWDTGGIVIVPSFAIGRTQELLYYISWLQRNGKLPRIPIYVDSPMATSTTELYDRSKEELDKEMIEALDHQIHPLHPDGLQLIRDRNASKALNDQDGPMMIIAGSGMANGGRVVHHLLRRLSDPSAIVLFTGYQAIGTLGRRLLDGEPQVHVLGKEVDVRASIERVSALSAHADQGEIMRWLHGFKQAPKQIFIVHGEPPAQAVLKAKIIEELGWDVVVPGQGDRFEL